MDEPEVWPAMLYQLDSFLSSSDLKDHVYAFADEHCAKFEANATEEQPLHTHELYTEFAAMIEAQLESFLASGTVSSAQLFQACKEAKERGDAVPAMDYLLASTEYEVSLHPASHCSVHPWLQGFVQLMMDFKAMAKHGSASANTANASEEQQPEWA